MKATDEGGVRPAALAAETVSAEGCRAAGRHLDLVKNRRDLKDVVVRVVVAVAIVGVGQADEVVGTGVGVVVVGNIFHRRGSRSRGRRDVEV
jgi:hypothetical protein